MWKTPQPRAMWGGKGLLQLSTLDHRPSLGKHKAETQGKNPEAETMKKCCFLACFSGFAHHAFKRNGTQNNLPRTGTTYSDLGPLTSNISQENVPIYFSTGIFSIGVPSSQVILFCVKLTKTKRNKTKTNQTITKTNQHCGSTGSFINTSLEFPHNLDETLGNYIE